MENTRTPDRPRRQIGIGGAIAGMVVTFLLGIYVGLHPAWLPIKTTTVEDFSHPLKRSSTEPTMRDQPTTTPTTQPTRPG